MIIAAQTQVQRVILRVPIRLSTLSILRRLRAILKGWLCGFPLRVSIHARFLFHAQLSKGVRSF